MPFPDWVLPGAGVTSILVFLITGFAKGWLLTSTQVERLMKAHNDEHQRLDAERLEWKQLALTLLQDRKEVGPVLDAVLQSLNAQRGLLTAIKDKAGVES